MAPLSYYRMISFMYLVIPESRRRRGEGGEESAGFFDFLNSYITGRNRKRIRGFFAFLLSCRVRGEGGEEREAFFDFLNPYMTGSADLLLVGI